MDTYEQARTDQLRQGDIIMNDGMRLIIDRPLTSTQATGTPTYSTEARIDNWAELVAQAEADKSDRIVNSSAAFIVHHAERDEHGDHRWTIQGNSLALWFREI
ncbi:hypothetical protein ACWIGW_44370 [Nocardia brasiliensis]